MFPHGYEGDDYQVWDPKRRVVVESRYLVFAYRRPHSTIRVHSPLTRTSRLYNLHLTAPLNCQRCQLCQMHPRRSYHSRPHARVWTNDDTSSTHPRITIRLPGCWMKRPAMECRDKSGEYDEATRPIYEVLHIPGHHVRLTVVPCSFSMRQRILQSRFRPVYLALADQWKEEMDQEMEGLKSHGVYELVPRINGMRTLKLGWVLHQMSKNNLFERNKGRPVARGNHQHPSIG